MIAIPLSNSPDSSFEGNVIVSDSWMPRAFSDCDIAVIGPSFCTKNRKCLPSFRTKLIEIHARIHIYIDIHLLLKMFYLYYVDCLKKI